MGRRVSGDPTLEAALLCSGCLATAWVRDMGMVSVQWDLVYTSWVSHHYMGGTVKLLMMYKVGMRVESPRWCFIPEADDGYFAELPCPLKNLK